VNLEFFFNKFIPDLKFIFILLFTPTFNLFHRQFYHLLLLFLFFMHYLLFLQLE